MQHQLTVTANKVTTTSKRYTVERVNDKVNYYYVNYDYPGLVWRNAIIFTILHILYVYGFYLSLAQTSWSSWLFSKYNNNDPQAPIAEVCWPPITLG